MRYNLSLKEYSLFELSSHIFCIGNLFLLFLPILSNYEMSLMDNLNYLACCLSLLLSRSFCIDTMIVPY